MSLNDRLGGLFNRVAGAGLLLLLAGLGTFASGQIQTLSPITPGPVKLELRLGGGRRQFHLGEIIPVELTFSSPERRTYPIGEDCRPNQSYQYHVPPEFVDRGVELDAALMLDLGGNCHGGHGEVDPGEKPLVVKQVLNERFRMDTPGKYQISVSSDRLGFSIDSSTVVLEILPSDPAWEESELKRGISMTAVRGAPAWEEGCRILRFLGTQAAEVQMARQEAGPNRCEFEFALISAKYRKPVLDELERGLVDPNVEISLNYLRALAFLSLYEQHPQWYPTGKQNAAPYEPTSGLWMQQRGVPQAEEIRYARLLAASLPTKTPEARALSLETLVYLGNSFGVEVPEDLRLALQQQMPGSLDKLPDLSRGYVLLHAWEEIKSPAMLAALEDLVEGAGSFGPDGIALRRLYELSPEEARPVILGQLSSFEPRVGVQTLSILPERELPELDSIMLHRLMAAQNDGALEASAGLLQRYASPAIADRVRPWFEERIGRMWCGAEANLIAYFLRIAPNDGTEMLREVMRTDWPGCLALRRLAETRISPEVQQVALEALDDARPAIVQEALEVLECHGSIASREPMLEHFRQWHSSWGSREKELEGPMGRDQTGVEGWYIQALGRAQGWLSSIDDWRSLRDLCVTQSCRERAQQEINNLASAPPYISFGFAEPVGREFSEQFGLTSCGSGGVNGLKEKMAQYPMGTVFMLDTRGKQSVQVQRVYDELNPWMAEHGFKLQLYREP